MHNNANPVGKWKQTDTKTPSEGIVPAKRGYPFPGIRRVFADRGQEKKSPAALARRAIVCGEGGNYSFFSVSTTP